MWGSARSRSVQRQLGDPKRAGNEVFYSSGQRARAAVEGEDLSHHQFGLGVKQWFLQIIRKTVGRWIPRSDAQNGRTFF